MIYFHIFTLCDNGFDCRVGRVCTPEVLSTCANLPGLVLSTHRSPSHRPSVRQPGAAASPWDGAEQADLAAQHRRLGRMLLLELQGPPGPLHGGHPPQQSPRLCTSESSPASTHEVSHARRAGRIHSGAAGERIKQ